MKHALWVGLCGLLVALTQSAHALPPTTDLFGCPIVEHPRDGEERDAWTRTHLTPGPVSLAHPPNWSVKRDGRSLTMESADKRAWLNLRWGTPGDEGHLDRVREDIELLELGPSQLSPRCQADFLDWLRTQTNWPAMRVSVTRRAFGMKRRSFALIARHDEGTLTLIVTVTWRKESHAALALATRLLSEVRADPGVDRDAEQAPASSARTGSRQRP